MSTEICVNARKLAYLMLEDGFSISCVKTAMTEIKQPAQGYYPISKITEYMKTMEHKKCKK